MNKQAQWPAVLPPENKKAAMRIFPLRTASYVTRPLSFPAFGKIHAPGLQLFRA
jgi:hypothetical protein